MKITWLGQAGFLFENECATIVVDPYLSDSCYKVNAKLKRRYPVNERFLNIIPDVIVLTHSHLDHTDPETLKHYLSGKSGVTVLASENAWNIARTFGGDNNYVMFNVGTEFTVKNITFKAVYACHSDDKAIGVIFNDGNTTYYVTGDTLYNGKIFENMTERVDVVFLPVNGVGNNMNITEACRFVNKIGAKKGVACHFGLFDNINESKEINGKGLIIPSPFREIVL